MSVDPKHVPRKPPSACRSMVELRAEIDALDTALITLLSERSRYIDRAVTLKKQETLPARIPSRVNEVIAHIRTEAAENDLDPDLAETLWQHLIEWSIAREARSIPE